MDLKRIDRIFDMIQIAAGPDDYKVMPDYVLVVSRHANRLWLHLKTAKEKIYQDFIPLDSINREPFSFAIPAKAFQALKSGLRDYGEPEFNPEKNLVQFSQVSRTGHLNKKILIAQPVPAPDLSTPDQPGTARIFRPITHQFPRLSKAEMIRVFLTDSNLLLLHIAKDDQISLRLKSPRTGQKLFEPSTPLIHNIRWDILNRWEALHPEYDIFDFGEALALYTRESFLLLKDRFVWMTREVDQEISESQSITTTPDQVKLGELDSEDFLKTIQRMPLIHKAPFEIHFLEDAIKVATKTSSATDKVEVYDENGRTFQTGTLTFPKSKIIQSLVAYARTNPGRLEFFIRPPNPLVGVISLGDIACLFYSR